MTTLAPDVPTMAFDEAKELTAQIKAATVDLWRLVVKAYEGKAWAAIGYPSWESYVTTEFQMSKQRAHQLLDYAAVRKSLGISDDESTKLTPREGQTRPLLTLETDEQKREALADAQQTAAAEGKPVTAKVIKASVDKVRAKRNGAAPIDPPPHAPGTISDAELDAGDIGDPVARCKLAFRECDDRQKFKALGQQIDDMPSPVKVRVAALILSTLNVAEIAELGRQVDFTALIETSRMKL